MLGKLRHLLLYIVVVVGLAACGGGGSNPAPAAPQTTTVLVYMVGSDLESGRGATKGTAAAKGNATINIQEMLAASGSDKVNVVLTTGGAAKDDPANLGLVKTWKTLKRHVVKNGKITELADLGRVNMADPATLTEFIKWAKTAYPADRYMLMFWDHGGGYYGFGGDENFTLPSGANPMFTVPDIVTTLKNAKDATGITFDFIGFDACLMATLEVANAVAPYARYLGASQELEPGTGWDWTVALNTLAGNPGIDAPSFGRALADGFIAKQEREAEEIRRKYGAAYLDDKYNTFSIVDLARMPYVVSALERFADAMLRSGQLNSPADWLKVAEARARAVSFGGNVNSDNDSYDLADLYVFAQRLQATNIVAAESATLQESIKSAVVYRKNGELVADTANGLSVYFPSRTVTRGADHMVNSIYERLTLPTAYKSMLKTYIMTASQTPHFVNIAVPVITANVMQSNVSSTLGIKEAHVILSANDDGGEPDKIRFDGVMRADMNSGYGGVSTDLGGGWLTLNGRPFAVVSIDTEYDPNNTITGYRYVIPVLRNGVATSLEVRETRDGTVVIGSWEGIGDDEVPARSGDPILPDDMITLLTVKLDTKTRTAEVTKSQMSPPFRADQMEFQRTVLTGGPYKLRFVVTDFAERDEFSAAIPYTP